MNQSAALDVTCEWENIVDFAGRHNARCQLEEARAKQKQNKKINKALYYAMGAAVAVLMECAGLVAPWVAVPAAMVLACLACFAAGKFVGNREARYGR